MTDGWDSEEIAWSPEPTNGAQDITLDDDQLLAALRRAIGARRAVPPEYVQAAKDAFAWHDIDAELAQLTYDSVHSPDLAAQMRAEDASIRALTFTSPRVTIELEVTGDALLGQVVPTQVATIEIQSQAGVGAVVSSDEIGCFSISPVPRGTFRLRCLANGGIDVRTGWVTLLSESGSAQ